MEACKPCNEMKLFKTYINRRVEIENVAALEQPNRREKLLKYWCFEGVVATYNNIYMNTLIKEIIKKTIFTRT